MKRFFAITLSLILWLLSPLTLAEGCCAFNTQESTTHCEEPPTGKPHAHPHEHCCHDHDQGEHKSTECQCDHHITQTAIPLISSINLTSTQPAETDFIYKTSHFTNNLSDIYRPPIL
jgi:hypothetical protein